MPEPTSAFQRAQTNLVCAQFLSSNWGEKNLLKVFPPPSLLNKMTTCWFLFAHTYTSLSSLRMTFCNFYGSGFEMTRFYSACQFYYIPYGLSHGTNSFCCTIFLKETTSS